MKRRTKNTTLEITTTASYAKYLKKHLAIEHPKTKGKMKIERD